MVNFDVSLIAYSEILLKSDPVRRNLENMLVKQIKTRLKMENLAFNGVSKEGGRIYVFGGDPEKNSKTASRVLGVDFSAPAIKTSTNLQSLIEASLRLGEEVLGENESFAVDARRVGVHPYTSKELETKIGAEILRRFKEKGLKVNLENPDKTIFVEVREKNAYVYSKIFRGWGGLPVGSQGRVVVLLGNKAKTTLAGWLMMKRGVFPLPLYLSQNDDVKNDFRFAEDLSKYIPYEGFNVYVAKLKDFSKALPKNEDPKLYSILQQRLAVRVACGLAKKREALGVVVGLTLDPKPTNVLRLLSYIEEVSTLPIFYPLIGFEDFEVNELKTKLGFHDDLTDEKFFDFSPLENYEGLTTKKIKFYEEKMNVDGLTDEIIKNIKVLRV